MNALMKALVRQNRKYKKNLENIKNITINGLGSRLEEEKQAALLSILKLLDAAL